MTDVDTLLTDLVEELPRWLPTQRWFGGKDRDVDGVDLLSSTTVLEGDPLLLHVVVEVHQGDRSEPYQLLVGSRMAQVPSVPASASLGQEGGLTCYEASGDSDLTTALLDLLAEGATVGDLVFEAEPGVELESGLRGRPISAEQSNTSLVYGSQYILKLFRKLAPGLNKDVVLHRALRDVGCDHIADPLGAITGRLHGEPVTLGMLQRFMPDAVDGWTMATTSVRDLMADPGLPEEHGGDFAGESRRLGHAVAVVHADLARALGTEDADEADVSATVTTMLERLDRVAADVPDLEPHVPALREALEAVGRHDGPITTQPVHGDLHLGQVLRTLQGWLLLDFEGEPAAPVAERAALRSPLRDVAGMLRSFDYVAHQLLVGQPDEPGAADQATAWATRNRDAFCEGYAEVEGGPIGDPRDHADLLAAFELDKAVYEVAYEHANRPAWLGIPLAAIARTLAERETP